MAATMKRFAPTLVAALVLLAAGFASAAPDPAECAFELGYNPRFSADGSILFCTKGMSKEPLVRQEFEGHHVCTLLSCVGFQSSSGAVEDPKVAIAHHCLGTGSIIIPPVMYSKCTSTFNPLNWKHCI
jgi:hypothetical protein